MFDLSIDFFKQRKNKEFFQGTHYFIPPTNSKTKKAVLWSIEAIENWLITESIGSNRIKIDSEIENLLKRR
jgi:hypothetical protein